MHLNSDAKTKLLCKEGEHMAIQYKKYGQLLIMCMERKYSTFTMEQLGLLARVSADGNEALDKMIKFCEESNNETELLKKAQEEILKK